MQPGAGGLEAELLLHAGWMRRLAAHLVDDADLADDAAQEAALSALARPPHGVRRPRAYLAEVVRNAARRLGRADQRRARRELQAARAEALPSAAELAADAELQQALATALLALDEPYRSTLVLRFYRDLEPTEIARLAGVPPGTVRSRLSRGLELLRARLDARCGGREAWSAALAPLARWTTAGRSGVAATAGIAGGLAMGIKVALACAGAAAVAGALYLGFRGSEERQQEELASAASAGPAQIEAPQALPGAKSSMAVLEPTASGAERVALAATAAAPGTPVVRILAHDDSDNQLAAGVSVALSPYGQEGPILATAVTDAEGRAEVRAEGLTRARLAWSAPFMRSRTRDLEDLTGEVELRIVWLGTLTGIVRDAETGLPLEGVQLQTSEGAVGIDEGAWSARTGPDGRYTFTEQTIRCYSSLHARAVGYLDRTESFHLVEPGETAALNVALEHGFELTLSVYDRQTGTPLKEASISSDRGPKPFAHTDAEGLANVRAGVGHELSLCIGAPGYCVMRWNWMVAATPAETTARIPMLRSAWIVGRITEDGGLPVAKASLSTECEECQIRGRGTEISEAEQRELGLHGSCLYSAISQPQIDAEGRFRLPVVPCGHARTFRAEHAGFVAHQVSLHDPLAPGEELRIDVQLARGSVIRGRVLEHDAPRWGVYVVWKDAMATTGGRADMGVDGTYELHVQPGPVTLVLEEGSEPLEERRVVVEPGQVLEQDFISAPAMMEIQGSVTASGKPVSDASITAYGGLEVRGRAYDARTDSEGAYCVSVPDKGLFKVFAHHGPVARSRPGVSPGATDVDFDLPPVGTLRLRLLDARTGEPARAGVAHDNMVYWRPAGQGSYQSDRANPDLRGLQDMQVEAGRVDVLAFLLAEGYAPRRVEGIVVPAGGTSEIVELAFERGLPARLHLEGDRVQPEDLRAYLLFLVEESELDGIAGPFAEQDGTMTYAAKGMWIRLRGPTTSRALEIDADGTALAQSLAPGRYHLRVFPDDFIFEPEAFDLPSPAGEPLAVRWRRR